LIEGSNTSLESEFKINEMGCTGYDGVQVMALPKWERSSGSCVAVRPWRIHQNIPFSVLLVERELPARRRQFLIHFHTRRRDGGTVNSRVKRPMVASGVKPIFVKGILKKKLECGHNGTELNPNLHRMVYIIMTDGREPRQLLSSSHRSKHKTRMYFFLA
jgi:hypothetical protein